MPIINELIDALGLEINALKKGKGGNSITIYNGQLLRKTLDFYIYQFTLENFLITLDDTPAQIEIAGKEYDCDVISVNGQQVQISIKQKLSEQIAVAKLKTNTWYLLERLKKKYEENLGNQSRFENSEKLFNDINSKIDGDDLIPSYTEDIKKPTNNSQFNAIKSSINDFIAIIWGPPGTGKTATIARAIESHLNLGRKVLLLSHSNNAVDQALEKVAEQTKNNYYKDCKLVRLGTPKAEMQQKFQSTYPRVLIDNITELKSKELINEKESLNNKIEDLKSLKLDFEQIIILNQEIKIILRQVEKYNGEINLQENKIKYLKNEVPGLQLQIKSFNEKLLKAKNAGFLKKTFLGLDPVKIESNLRQLNLTLSTKENQINNLEEQRKQSLLNVQPLNTAKRIKEVELNEKLSKTAKTLNEIIIEVTEFDNQIRIIQTRLDEISNAINAIKIKILSDSQLVATTLTKSYISKEIETIDFDILIVDEISMAPMPMLYWAASKVKKGITIVGDFNQLPPICISKDALAIKWLGKSIFDHLGISEISKAEARPVQLLDTQYRMNPLISEMSNKNLYDNRLKNHPSVNTKIKIDSISGDSPICLINTASHNPWCSQFETGGRFNLVSAIISVTLAEKVLKSLNEDETIGIITPYRNQARLILKIAEDKGLVEKNKSDRIRINTVHSFQGGEETVIIFDSVEGEGAKKWSIINEYNNTESAKLLLNVALTRAETKLYIVANCNYIKTLFPSNSMFLDILRHFMTKGKEILSTHIISDLKDDKFEFWIEKLNSLKNRPENYGLSYTSEEFWPAFHNDLSKAKKELIIFSPFLTVERFSKLHLIFTELIAKGVLIYVITLPVNEQPVVMTGSKEVMIKLKDLGVIIKFRRSMHEKIALIDREVKWIGSLNILSHNTRKEYMERVKGENSAKELFDKFDLEDLFSPNNLNGELCPQCQKEGISSFVSVRFNSQFKSNYYACSDYPNDCNFTANINVRNFGNIVTKTIPKTIKKVSNQLISTKSKVEKTTDSKDLFGNATNDKQWETPLCHWSSVQLKGYTYSKNKNAWWKKK